METISSFAFHCSLAALTLVVCSLFFAVVRWFHLCRPYDQHSDYYYPGRTVATLNALINVLLLVYVFRPEDPEAWFFVRVFSLTAYLLSIPLMVFSYFGRVKHWRKWRIPAIVGIMLTVSLLIVPLRAALMPRQQLTEHSTYTFLTFSIGCGILFSLYSILALRRLFSWIKQLSEDNFSNPEDFPLHFARRIMAMAVFMCLLYWAVFLLNNKETMAVFHIFMSGFMVFFLVLILHPQRTQPVFQQESNNVQTGDTELLTPPQPIIQPDQSVHISEEKVQLILRQIENVVVHKKGFLNPHLSIQDVADQCSYGRTYVSNVFKSELGGFFNYVNRHRLDYAAGYRKKHPDAKIDLVAEASGFDSRQSYYRVKKRMQH